MSHLATFLSIESDPIIGDRGVARSTHCLSSRICVCMYVRVCVLLFCVRVYAYMLFCMCQ